jgi:hypothetical protein
MENKSIADPAVLGRLPHRGETPMLWRIAVDAKGPLVTAAIRVPKAVVEDVVALAASHLPVHP